MPWLPAELINLVVTHVDDGYGNRGTLASCALAAQVFRHPAQQQLYRHLYIDNYWSGPRRSPATVAAHFAAFPHLARLVTSVALSLAFDTYSQTLERRLDSVRPLRSLLKQLTNVSVVSVWSVDAVVDQLQWSSSGKDFTNAIEELIQDLVSSSTLRQLEFSDFRDIPHTFINRMLTACPTVSILGLSVVHNDDTSPLDQADLMPSIAIERLKIGIIDISNPIMFKLVLPHVTSLRTLVLTMAGFSWHAEVAQSKVYELCLAVSKTLKYLSLKLPAPEKDHAITSFSIPPLPHLQYLQIGFENYPNGDTAMFAPPPRLLTILADLLVGGNLPSLSELWLRPDLPLSGWHKITSDTFAFPTGSSTPASLKTLDDLLKGCSAAVYCVPRFYPSHSYARKSKRAMDRLDDKEHAYVFSAYVHALRASLPTATALGLKIIDYQLGEEWKNYEVDFLDIGDP
ncbi:hypothetical protein MIND_01353500 [Mycena indigotica]|uniref:Uncharacterized protein n=1 Tax=Mycena indigotica TaxID=2126181 RepID=A0A8H6RZZ3_9AGAR|nr:uncharacterized protein MIND_01353500 [Mycena indigotica]KAF7289793.1 hypothetical protein MIND_01353500 [Mycena indigotica]